MECCTSIFTLFGAPSRSPPTETVERGDLDGLDLGTGVPSYAGFPFPQTLNIMFPIPGRDDGKWFTAPLPFFPCRGKKVLEQAWPALSLALARSTEWMHKHEEVPTHVNCG